MRSMRIGTVSRVVRRVCARTREQDVPVSSADCSIDADPFLKKARTAPFSQRKLLIWVHLGCSGLAARAKVQLL